MRADQQEVPSLAALTGDVVGELYDYLQAADRETTVRYLVTYAGSHKISTLRQRRHTKALDSCNAELPSTCRAGIFRVDALIGPPARAPQCTELTASARRLLAIWASFAHGATPISQQARNGVACRPLAGGSANLLSFQSRSPDRPNLCLLCRPRSDRGPTGSGAKLTPTGQRLFEKNHLYDRTQRVARMWSCCCGRC